jgi:very-short-patch-repair endonuclease
MKKENTRQQTNDETIEELGRKAHKALWQRLKKRQVGGYLFKQDQQVGPFKFHYYCAEKRLGVNLQHHNDMNINPKHLSAEQYRYYKANQLKSMTFEFHLIFTNIDLIVKAIHVTLDTRRIIPVQEFKNNRIRRSSELGKDLGNLGNWDEWDDWE